MRDRNHTRFWSIRERRTDRWMLARHWKERGATKEEPGIPDDRSPRLFSSLHVAVRALNWWRYGGPSKPAGPLQESTEDLTVLPMEIRDRRARTAMDIVRIELRKTDRNMPVPEAAIGRWWIIADEGGQWLTPGEERTMRLPYGAPPICYRTETIALRVAGKISRRLHGPGPSPIRVEPVLFFASPASDGPLHPLFTSVASWILTNTLLRLDDSSPTDEAARERRRK